MTKSLATRKLEAEIAFVEVQTQKMQLDVMAAYEAYEARTSRVFRFTDDVSNETVLAAVEWLDRMVEDVGKPATVAFSSYGGSTFDGLTLYDAMEAARVVGLDLTTVCSGYTASMASILMQAGTTRLATPHAWFHVHEPATSLWHGKTADFRDETKILEGLWEQSLEIFAKRSHLTAAQLRRRFERKEEYLTASEALDLGLIDDIMDGTI